MDGYSDQPFRMLCRHLGSAISYTEFVRAEDVLERPQFVEKKLQFQEPERPVFYQLYGGNANTLLEAALILQEREPDALDINLGCPNRSIANRGAGVGLMRTPVKTARIFRMLTANLEIPVTAKIRLGWNDCRTYALISRIIAENGGSLVAFHARTKEQGHFGPPCWEAIAEVKNLISIPVIGNGGIQGPADIEKMLASTNCDGVMVGRAALKNPWIFSGLKRDQIPPRRVHNTMLTHLEESLKFYGSERGLVLFRKYAASYLAPYQLPDQIRINLLTEKNPEDFRDRLEKLFTEMILDP